MKRYVLGLVAVLTVTASAWAGEGGFTKLFNGKNLDGWVYPGRKGKPVDGIATPDGRVVVKDGVIIMTKGRGIRDLYTQKEFGNDFILKLQFKAGERADSGVHIRGKQLQIRDFIRRKEQKQLKKFKTDGWNDLVIVVKGTNAVPTVNGEPLRAMSVPAKGPIGLQAESGTFEYRDVQLKLLK